MQYWARLRVCYLAGFKTIKAPSIYGMKTSSGSMHPLLRWGSYLKDVASRAANVSLPCQETAVALAGIAAFSPAATALSSREEAADVTNRLLACLDSAVSAYDSLFCLIALRAVPTTENYVVALPFCWRKSYIGIFTQ